MVNTLAGLFVIYALKWALAADDILANLVGYGVGLTISYVFNARWTFSFRGALASAVPRFALTIVAAYLANLATVSVALYVLTVNSYIAQAAGIAPYALVTYFGSKFFVFTNKRVSPPADVAGTGKARIR